MKTVLGVGLLAIAVSFLRAPDQHDIAQLNNAVQQDIEYKPEEVCIITAEGEEIRYKVCNRVEGSLISRIGALFMGMIATGLGELDGYFLLQRCRVPSKVSAATSVFVVAVTAIVASVGHAFQFAQAGGDELTTVFNIAIFTVPGVIVGAQLGSSIASRILRAWPGYNLHYHCRPYARRHIHGLKEPHPGGNEGPRSNCRYRKITGLSTNLTVVFPPGSESLQKHVRAGQSRMA